MIEGICLLLVCTASARGDIVAEYAEKDYHSGRAMDEHAPETPESGHGQDRQRDKLYTLKLQKAPGQQPTASSLACPGLTNLRSIRSVLLDHTHVK